MAVPLLIEDDTLNDPDFVLNPQWRQTAFLPARGSTIDDDSEEYESEDEVEYVLLDFGEHLTADALTKRHQIEFLALETGDAFVGIGGQVFGGEHQALLGHDILIGSKKEDAPLREVLPGVKVKHHIKCEPATLEARKARGRPPKADAQSSKNLGKKVHQSQQVETASNTREGTADDGTPDAAAPAQE